MACAVLGCSIADVETAAAPFTRDTGPGAKYPHGRSLSECSTAQVRRRAGPPVMPPSPPPHTHNSYLAGFLAHAGAAQRQPQPQPQPQPRTRCVLWDAGTWPEGVHCQGCLPHTAPLRPSCRPLRASSCLALPCRRCATCARACCGCASRSTLSTRRRSRSPPWQVRCRGQQHTAQRRRPQYTLHACMGGWSGPRIINEREHHGSLHGMEWNGLMPPPCFKLLLSSMPGGRMGLGVHRAVPNRTHSELDEGMNGKNPTQTI